MFPFLAWFCSLPRTEKALVDDCGLTLQTRWRENARKREKINFRLPFVARKRLCLSSVPELTTATSFPGSLLFTSQGATEGRPCLGLVTCLLESGRLQESDWSECQFAYTKCIGNGKICPSEGQLAIRACFKGHVQWSSRTLKKSACKASESVNVSCSRLFKSVGDIRHWQNLYSKRN